MWVRVDGVGWPPVTAWWMRVFVEFEVRRKIVAVDTVLGTMVRTFGIRIGLFRGS